MQRIATYVQTLTKPFFLIRSSISISAQSLSGLPSSVIITCIRHHYRISSHTHRQTHLLVLFSLCLHTARCECTEARFDRYRRSIEIHVQRDGKCHDERWHDEETNPTDRANKQASKQPTNQPSDRSTDWLTGKFIESISEGKECANDAGVNKDPPTRRIRYTVSGITLIKLETRSSVESSTLKGSLIVCASWRKLDCSRMMLSGCICYQYVLLSTISCNICI